MTTQSIVNNFAKPLKFRRNQQGAGGDRFGVMLSILCAIHCAATPFILLAAPAFGRVWSHPASHWLVALFVIPLAVFMVYRGYQVHRRKWVIACGSVGILLVIAGAAAPSFGNASNGVTPEVASVPALVESVADEAEEECPDAACATECSGAAEVAGQEADENLEPECSTECASASEMLVDGQADSEPSGVGVASTCVDGCCPSIQAGEDGKLKLHVPLASVLTTLGGLFLIATHVGNLCRCPVC